MVNPDGTVVSSNVRADELNQFLVQSLGLPYVLRGKLHPLDLQPQANHKLTDGVPGSARNHLDELPRGLQRFAGVEFVVGDSLIHLGGAHGRNWPQQVEGVAVGRKFARLCLLHATDRSAVDGTRIGEYRVRYADTTTQSIPIVYGQDVRNWWAVDGRDTTHSAIAWTGSNPAALAGGAALQLYVSIWQNPFPEKEVRSIDFVSTMTTAAPFCVAMSLESLDAP